MKKSEHTLLSGIIDVAGFLILSLVITIKSIILFFLPESYQRRKSLKGEIALITGGGGGIGRLVSLRLAKLGAICVVWDIDAEAVEETANLVKEMGGKAYSYKCDLANREEVYSIANKTKQEVGEITLLINNAGILSGYYLLDTPDDLIKRTFDVNILAHFWTVKAFLPYMIKKNHGHIVTIASMAGYVGINKLVDYCSSKHAAVGFDESLRVELESQGITGVKTTAICPYFIKATGMFHDADSRFLDTLKPNTVADRIVRGITKEETTVMIPGCFHPMLLLKAIFPWACASMFLRGLVPDPTPQKAPPTKTNSKNGNVTKFDSIKKSVVSVSESNGINRNHL